MPELVELPNHTKLHILDYHGEREWANDGREDWNTVWFLLSSFMRFAGNHTMSLSDLRGIGIVENYGHVFRDDLNERLREERVKSAIIRLLYGRFRGDSIRRVERVFLRYPTFCECDRLSRAMIDGLEWPSMIAMDLFPFAGIRGLSYHFRPYDYYNTSLAMPQRRVYHALCADADNEGACAAKRSVGRILRGLEDGMPDVVCQFSGMTASVDIVTQNRLLRTYDLCLPGRRKANVRPRNGSADARDLLQFVRDKIVMDRCDFIDVRIGAATSEHDSRAQLQHLYDNIHLLDKRIRIVISELDLSNMAMDMLFERLTEAQVDQLHAACGGLHARVVVYKDWMYAYDMYDHGSEAQIMHGLRKVSKLLSRGSVERAEFSIGYDNGRMDGGDAPISADGMLQALATLPKGTTVKLSVYRFEHLEKQIRRMSPRFCEGYESAVGLPPNACEAYVASQAAFWAEVAAKFDLRFVLASVLMHDHRSVGIAPMAIVRGLGSKLACHFYGPRSAMSINERELHEWYFGEYGAIVEDDDHRAKRARASQ
jgi:hypothetical protein